MGWEFASGGYFLKTDCLPLGAWQGLLRPRNGRVEPYLGLFKPYFRRRFGWAITPLPPNGNGETKQNGSLKALLGIPSRPVLSSRAITLSIRASKGRLPILKGTILFDFDSLPLIPAIPSYTIPSYKEAAVDFPKKENVP